MSAQIIRFILLLASLVLVVPGCGKKIDAPRSLMDSPEYHYRNGLMSFDSGRLSDAMRSFDRAVALDDASPLGYIGKGLTFGKKGEFGPAFENMSKARGLDKGIEARIGMIRLYNMQRAKDWVPDAEGEFKAARKIDPESARLHYYMGIAYKAALNFEKAADLFKTVLDMNREFSGEAGAEYALILKVQRAAPETDIGKKIALIDKIDRADAAALLDQEMNLEQLFTRRGVKADDTAFKAPGASTIMQAEKFIMMEPATDIADHWLKPSIDLVLKLHIRGLDAGPHHTFEPDKLIAKGDFALILENILIKVTGDEKLAAKFLGATSPFPDIRNDQYFFSAAMIAISRGFMKADKATGEFKPGDPVSGADALLSIHEFRNQLKF